MNCIRKSITIAVIFFSFSACVAIPQTEIKNLTMDKLYYYENFSKPLIEDWRIEEGWEILKKDENFLFAGEGHNWAVLKCDYNYKRFSFRSRLMIEKGGIHLNFRVHEEQRYFISFTGNGSSLTKQLSHNDYREDLAGNSAEYPPGIWHEIEIRVIDDSITFLVNGIEEWTYRDPDTTPMGVFGFKALDDSVVYLDDVYIYGPEPDPRYVWKRLGGPLGGLGYDIRMKPDDPDIMFVTDAFAGVYKSTDGGRNWYPVNKGITTRAGNSGDAIPVFSLSIDPNNHETIWIGTQDKRGYL